MPMLQLTDAELARTNGLVDREKVRAALQNLGLDVYFLAPGTVAIVDNNYVEPQRFTSTLHARPTEAFAEAFELVRIAAEGFNAASVRHALVILDRIEHQYFANITLALYRKKES